MLLFKPRILTALAVVVLSFTLFSCQTKYDITTSYSPLQVGDTTVNLVIHEAEAPGLTYFNLHDNENTSVKAALDVISEHGGRVIELKHSGDRRITFQVNDNSYEFDPNRMFSNQGRVATLERFSTVTDEALDAIRMFADEVLQKLNPTELVAVVTLHNTSQDNYSVLSYTSGGEYEKEAESTKVSQEMNPKDFYFVTDRDIYNQLSQQDQNIVLQNNSGATDDGSLSVWSAQQQIVYANVEALPGHRTIQADML